MFILYAPFSSQVMLMTRHIWEILPYTLVCCSAQSYCVLLWGSPARTPRCMPTASAHEGALARVQANLFEHRRHPGKFYWWGQVAEALGRNTPQGSIHEKPGKTWARLAARISFALSSSDVTQQVAGLWLSSQSWLPLGTPNPRLMAVIILSWNFLSYVAHWISWIPTCNFSWTEVYYIVHIMTLGSSKEDCEIWTGNL